MNDQSDIAVIRAVLERLEKQMVTQAEFRPVRLIAYGLVSLIMVGFVGAVSASVFR